jgi:hypothetical protein
LNETFRATPPSRWDTQHLRHKIFKRFSVRKFSSTCQIETEDWRGCRNSETSSNHTIPRAFFQSDFQKFSNLKSLDLQPIAYSTSSERSRPATMLRLFSSQFKLQTKNRCQLLSVAQLSSTAAASSSSSAPTPAPSTPEPMVVFAAKKDIDQSQWKMNFLTKLVCSFFSFLSLRSFRLNPDLSSSSCRSVIDGFQML